MPSYPRLGACFPREFPPDLVIEFAQRLESGGADELWVVEDCFYTAGISLAATALARTDALAVGIGILPAVARNPAITAMELATLARLAPGRLTAGIGHGVQDWMEQIGARQASPVTALVEVITAVRRLLAGETVSMNGQTVTLRDVRLDSPPDVPPPVVAGVRGPKSLAAAGRCADGVVLAEFSGPTAVRDAIDRAAARRRVAPFIVDVISKGGYAGMRATAFYDDLAELARGGAEAIVDAPDDWWVELGGVGTPDDVAVHIDALAAAGATSVAFFPPPDVDIARHQLGRLLDDVIARR
jgi:5,10-methylenetetrahydromethanopterin reductase